MGVARQGAARPGWAWLGGAGRGLARLGVARQGKEFHYLGEGMNKQVRTEHAEAVHFATRCRMSEARYPALKLLFACPNGGDRHRIVAAKMKAEGVKAGIPDYVLLFPAQGFHGLAIELKSLTGYASREQKDWIERLRANGYRAEVCRGADAAWAVVCDYLGIKP